MNILLWGAGSQSRIISEMIRESSIGNSFFIYDPISPVTDNLKKDETPLRNVDELKRYIAKIDSFVVCIGAHYGYARFITSQYLLHRAQLEPLSVIHENSFIDKTVSVGIGCQIMPGVVINKFARIGDFSILNTSSSVDHECCIGAGVHIMGAASLAGRVCVEDYSTIGTNATILPDLLIGKGCMVGAGSVVLKNVEECSIVAGVPAKHIKIQNLHVALDDLKEIWGEL